MTMATRKKTDVVQLSKIRMREALRAKLARDAERKGTTLSGEIVDRLEQSYQVDDRVELINTVRSLAPLTSEIAASLHKAAASHHTANALNLIVPPLPKDFQDFQTHLSALQKIPGGDAIITMPFREESSQPIDAENPAELRRRDSDIIDVLLSRNEASSHLLRAITLELAIKPDWSSSKSGISDMAEAIRVHVYSAERRLEEVGNDK
jgi:hypothetical protein